MRKETVKQIKFLDNFVFFIFHIMIILHIESYEIKEILKGRKK